MAFVKNVAENLGPEGRYVHYGSYLYTILWMTALALLLLDATRYLSSRAPTPLTEVIRKRAREHKNTVMIGRTHGISRGANYVRFQPGYLAGRDESQSGTPATGARVAISVGKISGAVGTHANISPDVEKYVCTSLGTGCCSSIRADCS